MTAIRTARSAEGKFVMISNGAARDRRLTAAARGIILFALSLPPDSHFTAEWLEHQLPDGRKAIRSALRNLEQCGYFRRTRTSVSGTWRWDQVISDAPLDSPEPEFPQVVASGTMVSDALICDDAPEPEFPQVAASGTIASDAMVSDKELKTDSPKTEDLKTGNETGPPAAVNDSAPPEAASSSRHIRAPRVESGDWRDDLDPTQWPPRSV